MVSGSKGAGQLRATNMPEGRRLGALYSVRKRWNGGGIPVPPNLQPVKNGIVAISVCCGAAKMVFANPQAARAPA
jgi:hypothetical protein